MKIIIAVIVLLLLVGWYLFRPERIFIDTTVNESLPEPADSVDTVSWA